MSPLESFFFELFLGRYAALFANVWYWAVIVAGILLCIYYFKKSKLKAYLVICLFFLAPFFELGLQQISYQIHKEELRAYAEQRNEELRQQYEEGIPYIFEHTIVFPIFETCLVVGLFLIARKSGNRLDNN